MKKEYKPYNTVVVKNCTYDDYSIKIKNTVYDVSVCRETQKLRIRRDELQRA